ncbi:uncharacterized protein LOC117180810 [Belonocnema kinseyi]|uniref:uncharacterized protein LOC117180810 n=1 Tax=Belonocnema kinseyi TaxID=2817044 RepID=UPI00143D2CDA|nr:uncharacterized protein LOC117180810 [Belonocnema kinseyi]XP_033229221.1 uncharacterized protein LOC117180810 [Belonocnema kinseyi]XP_033229222.1 uncharacterized protein LOC117180810 [Belonocnema kinseyi]
MVDNNCIIEGNVKFRDGKKWKSRWCVMRKLSPVADCLHLQLYGDSKDRFKQGQTKASLSLQHFLGVQSGFTIDKESNTIAIICQDVNVVLAFDTRERLIQWQVKISNNLGEDRQFLVLISTAPSKAKLNNGPAYFHVQDDRFCLTVGIPPRLVGIWEIAHLRRYGVIEGRFCFEGGSRCGRGEGLHVFITDQGNEIVKTLQLAAQGKLTTRKWPLGGGQTLQESPHRQFPRCETRASDLFPSAIYSSIRYEESCESCKNGKSPYWSSTESRQEAELEEDYSCRDSDFTSEFINRPGDWRSCSLSRHGNLGLERCASCIGKLGTISKSTTCGMTADASTISSSAVQTSNSRYLSLKAFDGVSLSSYSSSSHESDYSGSHKDTVSQHMECNYLQPNLGKAQSVRLPSPSRKVMPRRPPKPKPPPGNISKTKKLPMPLPNTEEACIIPQKQFSYHQSDSSIGAYNNYDVPKSILVHRMTSEQLEFHTDPYYDTPRKIKECIALPNEYPNYDTPHMSQAVVLQQCGCPTKLAQIPRSYVCPCQNLLNWAGFVLPYCRRGAGIEPTGVTVQPIGFSEEGKMPIINASGEIKIYPKNLNGCKVNHNEETDFTVRNASASYENIEPIINTHPDAKHLDYVNIDFTKSLENYENSKKMLSRTEISQREMEKLIDELQDTVLSCDIEESGKAGQKCRKSEKREADYLIMDVKNQVTRKPILGYLPMQPAHIACSKEILFRLCSGVKSSSNPTLSRSYPLKESRKKSEIEYQFPDPPILSSPYLRRRLVNGDDNNKTSTLLRKRSYSAESARYKAKEIPSFPSNLTIYKSPSGMGKEALLKEREILQWKVNDMSLISQKQSSSSCSPGSCIRIRRSSSVPSKTGHNRDSSSSNDSGVSTGSLTHITSEFVEFEHTVVPTSQTLKKKSNGLMAYHKIIKPVCFHNSLPRKSKCSDPLREITFQFQKIMIPIKSSSAGAGIPSCLPKQIKELARPNEVFSATCPDSRSTSSGTSDMSDYIETLSISSQSSSDAADSFRLGGRVVTTTLRPRSGKEYHKIDRSILVDSRRSINSPSHNYANITTVIEKSESPSPGYMRCSPFQR